MEYYTTSNLIYQNSQENKYLAYCDTNNNIVVYILYSLVACFKLSKNIKKEVLIEWGSFSSDK